jgi:hypothetical protein
MDVRPHYQCWEIGNVWCTPWTNTPTVYMFFIDGVTLLEIEIYTCVFHITGRSSHLIVGYCENTLHWVFSITAHQCWEIGNVWCTP